jgi:hypothetical protein
MERTIAIVNETGQILNINLGKNIKHLKMFPGARVSLKIPSLPKIDKDPYILRIFDITGFQEIGEPYQIRSTNNEYIIREFDKKIFIVGMHFAN